MAKPIDFNIQEIVEALQGTANTIDEVLPEGMDWSDLTAEDHAYIDQEIFNCATCGWWYEISEQSDNEDENTCIDCHEDEDR